MDTPDPPLLYVQITSRTHAAKHPRAEGRRRTVILWVGGAILLATVVAAFLSRG